MHLCMSNELTDFIENRSAFTKTSLIFCKFVVRNFYILTPVNVYEISPLIPPLTFLTVITD